MAGVNWLSLLFIIGFVGVHFSTKYLKLSTENPRSPWLSVFGGATIAYVFLYLLPELHKYLGIMKEAVGDSWLAVVGDYTYLLALIGLLVYFGLDTLAKTKQKDKGEESGFPVFLVHLSSFFIYNLIIGYLLIREEFSSQWSMALYFLALAAHFVATDHTLKEIHKEAYDRYGRWFLVAALLIGWLIGVILKVHEVAVGIAVSFLVGGILLNVFKDELKQGGSKNYLAFLSGAGVILALFIVVRSL